MTDNLDWIGQQSFGAIPDAQYTALQFDAPIGAAIVTELLASVIGKRLRLFAVRFSLDPLGPNSGSIRESSSRVSIIARSHVSQLRVGIAILTSAHPIDDLTILPGLALPTGEALDIQYQSDFARVEFVGYGAFQVVS
jgi:hypothetical protein